MRSYYPEQVSCARPLPPAVVPMSLCALIEATASQVRKRKQPGVQPGASCHIASRAVLLEEYYTNSWLAEKVATLAMEEGADLYLEPAVGGGAILCYCMYHPSLMKKYPK